MVEDLRSARTKNALAGLTDYLRHGLSRIGLRPGEYGGDYDRLARLYRRPDPWRLGRPHEIERYRLTNEVIRRFVPAGGSLLEIGSGEGHQTEHLIQVAQEVVGIEISAEAVCRARVRVPSATFQQGRGEDISRIVGARRFAIATACEVLCYSPAASSIVDQMKKVADCVLVTSYSGQEQRVAAILDRDDWLRLPDIVVGRHRWHCRILVVRGTEIREGRAGDGFSFSKGGEAAAPV